MYMPSKVHVNMLVKIYRWKGLAGGPLGQRDIFGNQWRDTDANKTVLITYLKNDMAFLLKSGMRKNLKYGYVRGLIVASGRWWL